MRFEELIHKINPKLKAISCKLNNRYTYFDEKDLYQEAITHLWQEHESGSWDDKTESYIVQNCYYFLKNYIRKTHKSLDRSSLSLDAEFKGGLTISDTLSDKQSDFSVRIIDAHLLLNDIKITLTSREKNIFMMHLDGFTTREIGNLLGISHVMVIKIEKKIRHKYAHLTNEILLN